MSVHNPTDLTELEEQLDDIEETLADILIDLAALQADVTALIATVAGITAIVNALPVLAETGGTITTDGTEQNVYINARPVGLYNPICVKIDCTNQTAGETIVIRQYAQVNPIFVFDRILQDELTYVGLISPELIVIDLEPNRFGIAVTIERTGGVARDYIWEVFYEI